MARYAAATFRPILRYAPGGSAHRSTFTGRRLIIHTAVSNASSMFGFFNEPGRATPHFYVNRDGAVEQFIDTAHGSSANLEGNHDCITVETWDGGTGPWSPGPEFTPKQVEALARLAAWCYTTHGIPLERLPSSLPGTQGVGWHRLGIDGNFPEAPGELLGGRVTGGEHWTTSPGKVCPTDTRIKQIVGEILPRAIVLANPPRKHVPVRVWFANLDFSTGPRADKQHLIHLCRKADVLLLVECKNVDVAALLPDGWVCNQDRTSDDRAGSVVAWRTDMFNARKRKLSLSARPFHPVTGKRLDMLTRWDNVQRLRVRESGERYRFVANHMAPDRDSVLWPEQFARLGLIRGRLSRFAIVVGTDANQPLEDAAHELRLIPHGRGIVGLLTPGKKVRVLDGPHIDRFGLREDATDHPAIGATIQRRNRKK